MSSTAQFVSLAIFSLCLLAFLKVEGNETLFEVKDFAQKAFSYFEGGMKLVWSSKLLSTAAVLLGAFVLHKQLSSHLSALQKNAKAQEYVGEKESYQEERMMAQMYACGKAMGINCELIRQVTNFFFDWETERSEPWFQEKMWSLKAKLYMSADHNSMTLHPKTWLSSYFC